MGNCGFSSSIFLWTFCVVLNEVDKLIAEVWQGASQCGHDGVVEMGLFSHCGFGSRESDLDG